MICLYKPNATNEELLTTNGIYVLDNIIKRDNIREVLNGTYEYDLVLHVDLKGEIVPTELYDHIKEDYIIGADDEGGREFFRISSLDKSSSREINIYTRHITISDTLTMWLEDVRPTKTNGLGALTHIFSNAKGNKRFTVNSNISTLSTSYFENITLHQALMDSDNSFLKRWGGEIKRKGFNLTINDKIGTDRGFSIRSKKNLQGFNMRTNIDSVATVLYIKGYDGIKLDTPVESPLVKIYSRPIYKEIVYPDIKVKSENNNEGYDTLEEAQAEMLKRAKEEFSIKNIDKIKATFTINYYDLSKTEEYKEYGITEQAFIGDTVTVKEDIYNTDIKVRVIERNYSPTLKCRYSTVLSNEEVESKSISIESIISEIEKSKDKNPSMQGYIDSIIRAGFKDSHVIPKENEVIVADNKELDKAVNVIRLNKNGLGYSSSGYWGRYEYGFSIDGKINASMILTGILSAIQIINADGSFQIDLSGVGGATFYNNGIMAMKMERNQLKMYNWYENGDYIGSLGSLLYTDTFTPVISLWNALNSTFMVGYEKAEDSTIGKYIEFDKYGIKNPYPVTFFEDLNLNRRVLNLDGVINQLYSSNGKFILKSDNGFNFVDKNYLSNFRFDNESFAFSKNSIEYFFVANALEKIWCDWDFTVNKKLHVNGDLAVVGNKNCIQKTENYGDRLYYSVEDTESYLTDRTMEILTVGPTTEGTFERVVLIDNIFKESVNLEIPYTVEVIKQGWGDYRIKEQTKDYFIVESDRVDFTFKYVITGKRRGFEGERLQEYFREEGEVKNEY